MPGTRIAKCDFGNLNKNERGIMKKLLLPLIALGLNAQARPLDLSVKNIEQTMAAYMQKAIRTQYCSENGMICLTPMMNTRTLNSTISGHMVNLNQTNLGFELKNPGTNLLITFKGSLVPVAKYDSVKGEYDEKVEKKVEDAAKYQIITMMRSYGITDQNPHYDAILERYYNLSQAARHQIIAQYQNEGTRRLDKLELQDSIQEVVVGFENETYFFRVGKMVAGTFNRNNYSPEEENYIAHKSITEVAKTNGFARGNIEMGLRELGITDGVKMALVGFVGKEGRFFLSAQQDTMNALSMSKEEFDNTSELIGFDSYGANAKLTVPATGHEMVITVISGSQGVTAGSTLRIPLSENIIAHAAYIYANKLGLRGNQARGQVDFHIGRFAGLKWVFAPFYEHYEGLQSFDLIPEKVVSKNGKISGDRFGAALTAMAKRLFLDGLGGSVTVEGYYDNSTVDDSNGADTLGQGAVGQMSFRLNFN